MNKILIASEKHGDRYFDASTDELIWAAAYKLLKERAEEDWYYLEDPPSSVDILTEEQIATIPIESLKKKEQEKLKEYNKRLDIWKRDAKEYHQIEQIIKDEDHKLAWGVIKTRSRAGYEYETVTIDTTEDV